MGFCRRCGDIVVGLRCKCGGSAVAPAVKWPDNADEPVQDKWSKTYVTKAERSPTRTPDTSYSTPVTTGTSANRRFPRPTTSTSISTRVSAHIASATASRPPSPLKQGSDLSKLDDSKAEEGILPSPHGSELAKVYGSVLQPKETLDSFACASCSTPFPPDATIYPDPSEPTSSSSDPSSKRGTRFLCRSCFTTNGGSRGDCPTCSRPVLILKSEGGFVENGGRVWHKKCFVCDGCGKNIGDNPMVDLLSRPCCPDCFDSCLKRTSHDSPRPAVRDESTLNRLGGNRRDSQSRESSPALDELEKRLGIARARAGSIDSPVKSTSTSSYRGTSISSRYNTSSAYDASPRALPGLTTPDKVKPSGRVDASIRSPPSSSRRRDSDYESSTGNDSPNFSRYTQTRLKSPELEEESPVPRRRHRYQSTGRDSLDGARSSPRSSISQPTEQAIDEMKRRFLSGSPATTPTKATTYSNSSTPRRRSKSRSRSRPRASDTSVLSSSSSPAETENKKRTLRSTASTSSLRSALRSQRTGDRPLEDDAVHPDITGDSVRPLRIMRRDRTGDTQTTVQENITGSTQYYDNVRPQRTGDAVYGVRTLDSQNTGLTVQPQRTGDTDYTMLASQVTGDTSYSITRHRTGDGIGSQNTGYAIFPPLHPQKPTEAVQTNASTRRESKGDTIDRLRADRTGDAEVASLLGSFPADDLIDLSGRGASYSSRATGSISKIPQLSSRLQSKESPRTSTVSSSSVSEGYESSVSSTPSLGDFSDTTSAVSSGPSTPPSLSPPLRGGKRNTWSTSNATPTPKSRTLPQSITIPDHVPSGARCEKCREPLFSVKYGGKFVTVPEEPTSTGAPPKRYHTACFKCKVCGDVFEEREGGHAVFVRVEEGACHVRCAPPERITLRKIPATPMPKFSESSPGRSSTGGTPTSTAYYSSSSRYERPMPTAPATTNTFSIPQPRFGGSATCPGCHKAVSPMERGVVPGPQGTRWHGGCLICGGESAKGKRKEEGKPGCGKKLDSAAKSDAQGGVWCRECLLLLPAELRQASPVRPIVPMSTGTSRPMSFVAPQYTGTTTLARQFTGLGLGSDNTGTGMLRQTTGGGWSPTKTAMKMHDGPRPGAGRMYPRPKSVTGTRSTGGEGRGMFLVRQLTGGNSSFSGNEYGL